MKILRFLCIAAACATACTTHEESGAQDYVESYVEAAPMAREATASLSADGGASYEQASQIDEPDPARIQLEDRMLIKTGNLSIEVEDYDSARVYILARVEQADGYIAGENETNDPYRKQNRTTIRVPAEHFDHLVEDLAGVAIWVQSKTVNSRDVTEEFVDQEARLRTKKAVEERFLNILRTARTVKDVLAVENEMRKLREEIESTEGRLKYLRSQVSLSTVNLSYYQDFKAGTPPGESFLGRLGKAFGDGFQRLVGFVLTLVRAWPWLIVLAVVGLLIRRYGARRKPTS